MTLKTKSFTIVHKDFKGGRFYEIETDDEILAELIKENEKLLYEVDLLKAQLKAFKIHQDKIEASNRNIFFNNNFKNKNNV